MIERGMTNNVSRLAIEMEKILNRRKKCKKKKKNVKCAFVKTDDAIRSIKKKIIIVKKMFGKKK